MWYMTVTTPQIYDYDLFDFCQLRKTHTSVRKKCGRSAEEVRKSGVVCIFLRYFQFIVFLDRRFMGYPKQDCNENSFYMVISPQEARSLISTDHYDQNMTVAYFPTSGKMVQPLICCCVPEKVRKTEEKTCVWRYINQPIFETSKTLFHFESIS